MFNELEVEEAAKAWLKWQFGDSIKWKDASAEMKEKLLEGSKIVLEAAALAKKNASH
jgi:hypothetical protein